MASECHLHASINQRAYPPGYANYLTKFLFHLGLYIDRINKKVQKVQL